jgi:hypothetical protein
VLRRVPCVPADAARSALATAHTERAFLDQGIHTSWETLRSQLSTHQVVTVRLPTTDGRAFTIRRDTRPEQIHRGIYRVPAYTRAHPIADQTLGPKNSH